VLLSYILLIVLPDLKQFRPLLLCGQLLVPFRLFLLHRQKVKLRFVSPTLRRLRVELKHRVVLLLKFLLEVLALVRLDLAEVEFFYLLADASQDLLALLFNLLLLLFELRGHLLVQRLLSRSFCLVQK